MARPRQAERKVMRYGLPWPEGTTDDIIERTCFTQGLSVEQGGLGRYGHFRKWLAPVWPDIDWNPWTERVVSGIFDDRYAHWNSDRTGISRCVALTGCGAAGKTYGLALAAMGWWRAAPKDSAVILCTTQLQGFRRRMWPVITQLHSCALDEYGEPSPVGKLTDSKVKIVFTKGDDVHGIFGCAVERGELARAVALIRGIHATRVFVGIDELEFTPPAILECIPNLRKGASMDFTLVVAGNSESKLDPHGMCCEPEDGWNSINVESDQWVTKGVSKWAIDSGICLHFDGEKSPNVIPYEGKSPGRKTVFPYIYTWEDHLRANREPQPGEIPFNQTTVYWHQDRGFWCPAGIKDVLLEEAMFEAKRGPDEKTAYEKFTFVSRSRSVGFLDPAFGGDECKVVFGRMGDIDGDRDGLQIDEHLTVSVSATNNSERDYQIARSVMEMCKARGVEPDGFGCDATGSGRGVHAILCGEWSPEIHRVEFGGAASDRNSGTADMRPADEVYANFVTELWYSVRDFLLAGQMRGFYPDAVIQFCARPYKMAGRRFQVLPKDECRAVMRGRSPDDADAVAGLLEVCRRLGLTASSRVVQRRDSNWEKNVQSAADIAAPQNDLNDVADEEQTTYGNAELDLCDIAL